MPFKNRMLTATAVGIYCSALASPVIAEENGDGYDSTQSQQSDHSVQIKDRYDLSKPELKNAWLESKLETALLVNGELNNFSIDHEVDAGRATLTGTVESDVDRELAEQVALGIDGINAVDNRLVVKQTNDQARQDVGDTGSAVSQKLDDMATTAAVKSKLLANQSTHGLAIDVDTVNNVVSIQGNVESTAEKQLVEQIAKNTDGVREVKNRLKVEPTS